MARTQTNKAQTHIFKPNACTKPSHTFSKLVQKIPRASGNFLRWIPDRFVNWRSREQTVQEFPRRCGNILGWILDRFVNCLPREQIVQKTPASSGDISGCNCSFTLFIHPPKTFNINITNLMFPPRWGQKKSISGHFGQPPQSEIHFLEAFALCPFHARHPTAS